MHTWTEEDRLIQSVCTDRTDSFWQILAPTVADGGAASISHLLTGTLTARKIKIPVIYIVPDLLMKQFESDAQLSVDLRKGLYIDQPQH